MTDKFDELSKDLAQSVTRRQALRRFSVGLAGAVLASIGLATKAAARGADNALHKTHRHHCQCKKPDFGCNGDLTCYEICRTVVCPGTGY